jgi:hypothetical protein
MKPPLEEKNVTEVVSSRCMLRQTMPNSKTNAFTLTKQHERFQKQEENHVHGCQAPHL